jgi:glucose-6-phosphate dehydrogenase assembly protein OpcA
MRYIAPGEDLEILDAAEAILCIRCQKSFYSKPGLTGKAGGRCACGAWICPVCMGCQTEEAAQNKATSCTHQRKRFLKKLASEKN